MPRRNGPLSALEFPRRMCQPTVNNQAVVLSNGCVTAPIVFTVGMKEIGRGEGNDTIFLNLFRAIAASWVMITHCLLWSGGRIPLGFDPKMAVDLFMVISGFLMMYTVDKGTTSPRQWSTWRRFYLRRFFRIAPAYYVALIAMAFLWPEVSKAIHALQSLNANWSQQYWPQNQDLGVISILLHMTFIFGFSPTYSFSTALPDWSLSLEMQFYAAFPFIFIFTRRLGFASVCLSLSLVAMGFSWQYLHGVEKGALPAFDEPSLLMFKLPMFIVGMLICEGGLARRSSLIVIALVVFVISARWYAVGAYTLFVTVAAIAYFWWFGTPQRLKPIVSSKAVQFLSDTSYSVYLFHFFAITLIGWPIFRVLLNAGVGLGVSRIGLTVSVVSVVYPLAWVIYRAIEVPGIRLGKIMVGRKQLDLRTT
jgi:peptidoglycan/LPS O-acetylase OafA/YrhL